MSSPDGERRLGGIAFKITGAPLWLASCSSVVSPKTRFSLPGDCKAALFLTASRPVGLPEKAMGSHRIGSLSWVSFQVDKVVGGDSSLSSGGKKKNRIAFRGDAAFSASKALWISSGRVEFSLDIGTLESAGYSGSVVPSPLRDVAVAAKEVAKTCNIPVTESTYVTCVLILTNNISPIPGAPVTSRSPTFPVLPEGNSPLLASFAVHDIPNPYTAHKTTSGICFSLDARWKAAMVPFHPKTGQLGTVDSLTKDVPRSKLGRDPSFCHDEALRFTAKSFARPPEAFKKASVAAAWKKCLDPSQRVVTVRAPPRSKGLDFACRLAAHASYLGRHFLCEEPENCYVCGPTTCVILVCDAAKAMVCGGRGENPGDLFRIMSPNEDLDEAHMMRPLPAWEPGSGYDPPAARVRVVHRSDVHDGVDDDRGADYPLRMESCFANCDILMVDRKAFLLHSMLRNILVEKKITAPTLIYYGAEEVNITPGRRHPSAPFSTHFDKFCADLEVQKVVLVGDSSTASAFLHEESYRLWVSPFSLHAALGAFVPHSPCHTHLPRPRAVTRGTVRRRKKEESMETTSISGGAVRKKRRRGDRHGESETSRREELYGEGAIVGLAADAGHYLNAMQTPTSTFEGELYR